jgi:hypothetical protein
MMVPAGKLPHLHRQFVKRRLTPQIRDLGKELERLAVVGAAIDGHPAACATAGEGQKQLSFSRRVVLKLDHSGITRALRVDRLDGVIR